MEVPAPSWGTIDIGGRPLGLKRSDLTRVGKVSLLERQSFCAPSNVTERVVKPSFHFGKRPQRAGGLCRSFCFCTDGQRGGCALEFCSIGVNWHGIFHANGPLGRGRKASDA